MLMLRSRVWTPLQKVLLTVAGILALGAFGTLVYNYEHYHRAPSESVFFGTWEMTFAGSDNPHYLRLRRDQTFQMASSPAIEDRSVFLRGRWYAGGSNMYVRFNADSWGSATRPEIWAIKDISQNKFSVRFPNGGVYEYERVK